MNNENKVAELLTDERARQIMFAAYSRCVGDDRLTPNQIADVLLSARAALASQLGAEVPMTELAPPCENKPSLPALAYIAHARMGAQHSTKEVPSVLDADEMTRLRRLISALGHADAFEMSDEYVRGVLCTMLGQAAGWIEQARLRQAQPVSRDAVLEEAAQECRAVSLRHADQDKRIVATTCELRIRSLKPQAAAPAASKEGK